MKKRLLVLALTLLALAMFLVACVETKPNPETTTIDLAEYWAGNENEDIYTLEVVSDGLKVSFNKGASTYPYVKRNLLIEDAEVLKTMKTLVMKLKTDNAAGLAMLVKIEFSGENAAKEAKFSITGEYACYEWDLSTFPLDQAVVLYFFVDPGVEGTVGSFCIADIYLTEDAINEEHNIDKTEPVTTLWHDSGDGVYTVTEANDISTIAYNKGIYEWAYVKTATPESYNEQSKTFNITVKGEEGKQILVKVFDHYEFEKWVTFTGEVQTVEIDLTKATGTYDTAKGVLIFAEPGTKDVSGTFEIDSFGFSDNAIVTELNLNMVWTDGPDGVYTVTQEEDGTKLAYDKGEFGWAYAKGDYVLSSALDLTGFNSIRFTIKGTADKTVIFKAFDYYKLEKTVTLTEEWVTYYINLKEVEGVDATKSFILFAQADTTNVSGEVWVKDVIVSKDAVPEVVTTTWKDSGDNAYTITENEGVTTVEYDKKNFSWAYIAAATPDTYTANCTKLTITLKGEAGKTVLVKVFDHYEFEVTVTFTGEAQTIEIDLTKATATYDSTKGILIFAEAGTENVTGTFEIHGFIFE
ncbi:MAG: hypothetical protein PHX51_05280 [Clostridia bacterium]|nr:hypothetical protein [Clostridia bacterium]